MKREKILDEYRTLTVKYDSLAAKEKKILLLLSLMRLIVFLGGMLLTIVCFMVGSLAGTLVLIISLVTFLILLMLFARHSERFEFFSNLSNINRNEAMAFSGDLSPFPGGERWIDPDHDFSHDIDLFGSDSLFQYLNRTVTGYGMTILAGWLSDPAQLATEITQRQAAIKELAAKAGWRQEFLAYGTGRALDEEDVESLLSWIEDRSQEFSSKAVRTVTTVFPFLALLTLSLALSGVLHFSFFVMAFLVNLLITSLWIRKTNRIHAIVSKKYSFLSSLARLMKTFEDESFQTEIMVDIRNCLTKDYSSAVARIRRLSRIIQSFDSRLNLMIGFILNGLLLWDLHCIRALERWKRDSSGLLPLWLRKTGEADAYISLSNYAYNHPDYVFPDASERSTVISAKGLGHPLISDKGRICNDFEISGSGRIGIITGANMAGKSTFLRTVAVNFVLGMTGSPVCAEEMTFMPLKLFTSMRTTDSLSHNESYFYAELKRLKSLKERLEANEKILFILDEILKGTNSTDKSTGSRLFIRKIIEYDATGLIATHDISLGDMEKEYPGVIFNKCFEIEINGQEISFDYILRNGITSKMNAALLMKQMGIVG